MSELVDLLGRSGLFNLSEENCGMGVRNDFKKIFETEDMATSFAWILIIDGIFHKLRVDNTSQCLIYIYISKQFKIY